MENLRENNQFEKVKQGFFGGSVVKNLPANAGDTGLIPGLGRSHMLQSNEDPNTAATETVL